MLGKIAQEKFTRTSKQFNDRVVLVTGGGTGIGRAIALRFSREGAAVTVMGRRLEKVRQVRQEIESQGGKSLEIQGDVSVEKDCQTTIAQVIDRFGRLDVLCTSAGIYGRSRTVVDTSVELWQEVIDIDLKGAFLISKYAIPEIQKRSRGAVIHIASIGALRGSPEGMAFQAAKGGLINLTKHMAVAHAPENIRVNCICPGVIMTPLTEKWLSDPKTYQKICQIHPLGRIGKVEEVASVAVFLASDDASFITGAILPVDGGYLAAGIR